MKTEVLWLGQQEVVALGGADMGLAVEAVREALLLDARGECTTAEVGLKWCDGGSDAGLYSLPAYLGGEIRIAGQKWTGHSPHNPERHGLPRILGLVLLNDPETLLPVAVMDGTAIGTMRTAAVTVLALDRLAPPGVTEAAVFGAGVQARNQIRALRAALPGLARIRLWGRTRARAESLAEDLAGTLDLRIDVFDDSLEAARGASLWVTASAAPEPYLTPGHLDLPGLLCHVGFNDVSFEALDCFPEVYVDNWELAKGYSGQSLYRLWRAGRFPESRVIGTLGQLLAGKAPRPTWRTGGVLFNAFGLSINDLAIARRVYQEALRQGAGIRLPLWDRPLWA